MPGPRFRHHNQCTRCPVIGAEDIAGEEWYQLLALRFNIQAAQKLSQNHIPVLVDRAALEAWLKNTRIDRAHAGHLPDDLGPGIQITLPSGCGMPIIDGNHRAARALRDGKDFFVFILSEDETLELLRRSMGRADADHYWKRLSESEPHPDDAPR